MDSPIEGVREIRLGVERDGPLEIEEGCTLKIRSKSGRGSFCLLRIPTPYVLCVDKINRTQKMQVSFISWF